jgi:hypothetical protein
MSWVFSLLRASFSCSAYLALGIDRVFLNRGDHLRATASCRMRAQFAPAFAVVAADLDGDGE